MYASLALQKELRKSYKKKAKESRLLRMSDPDRMWSLRMKFFEQVKKYFGVPYAKRYWQPEGEQCVGKEVLFICFFCSQYLVFYFVPR